MPSFDYYILVAPFDAEVKRRYIAGQSTYEVAASLSCSQGKVARSLRRTKTPRRTGAPSHGKKRA